MNKIESAVVDIKMRQAMDSVVLESVRIDDNSTPVLYQTIHGSLNSSLFYKHFCGGFRSSQHEDDMSPVYEKELRR